uniref:Uncharacterized protein n=1 Tax=Spongospora subterranea TaxID=70186 RepID=A0A0H5R0G8_9EUKA|eukprot:CRZ07481.1 hypothetical protein [Spongospora subterranea]
MELDIDQLVWVNRTASESVLEERQSRRFLPRLTGPWRVLSQHSNALDTYRLRHLNTGREASFNVDQMVPVRGNHEETGDNHRRNQDEAAGVDDNNAGAGASRDGRASDSAIPSLDADDGDFEPYNPADFETSDDESDRDETYAQASASSLPRNEHTGPRRSVRFACIGLRGVYGDGP